jgi:hypothetical protein
MRRTLLFALAIGFSLVSSAAWAGDLRCHLTDKEGPQADVQVTVTPGGTTLTTARDGTCLFRGLREGTYRVTAEKTVGEELSGAVQDGVRVPARGVVDAKLQLVRAIHTHEYTPLRDGSRWRYQWWRTKWGDPDSDVLIDEATVGRARFAGADVAKLEWIRSGWMWLPHPIYATYETSGPEGYTIYGRTPGSGEEPGYRYDPPLLVPDLCPQGHAHRLTTRVRYTDDRPSVRVARTYTLTKFESERVSAGAFDDCARIEWTEDAEGTTTTGVMYLAKGVGMVRMTLHEREIQEHLQLLYYRPPAAPAPSAARTVPRTVKPKPPSGTVQTPGKSVPSK